MALSAARQKSPAFDELPHLTAGYNIWLNHDFRFDAGNGDFVKRWAALPLMFSRPAFPPRSDPDWRQGDFFATGFTFFFHSGNDPALLLAQGRAMVALLGAVLGLLVFTCARELFGNRGGLLALVLFVFCPHMLAHGALVSTDLALSLTLLASTWCIWRLLHTVTWGRLFLSLAVLGLLLLSKTSAALIVPITGVMLAVRCVRGGPMVWRLGPERILPTRGSQAVVWAGLIAAHAIVGWTAVWAGFNFRYSAEADHPGEGLVTSMDGATAAAPDHSLLATPLACCRRWHFLPEGYLNGPARLLGASQARASFMNGHWKLGGWRTFFPYAFLVKTPPALFLLLPLGAAGWWRWRRRPPPQGAATTTIPSFYAATPFFALVAVYGAAAIVQNLNIGHRHILPLYPALYVLAGSAALGWPARAAWSRITAALLVLWFVCDSCAVRPDYLAYFNVFAGGPAQGYRHLVDSSLDWGMDLPGFKHWLDRHNPGERDPVFFAYFGTGSPEHYGISSRRLPGFLFWQDQAVAPLEPGWYAISATLLESVCTQTFGPWNRVYEMEYQNALAHLQAGEGSGGAPHPPGLRLKTDADSFWEKPFSHLRFGRLCAWLRTRRPPDDAIGHSILIWKLSASDLQAALLGPPAELRTLPATAGLNGQLGDDLLQLGLVTEAVQQYQEALTFKPDSADAHYSLGRALTRADRLPEAIQHFEDALRLQPDFIEAQNDLGNALAQSGQLPEAVRHYEAALRLRPDFFDAQNNLGNALAQSGRLPEAIRHYEEAVRLQPDFADAHYNLGHALTQAGRVSEAIRHYEEAVRLQPDSADAHNNLGNAFSRTGRLPEAMAQYEAALRLNPDHGIAHRNLGNVLRQMGRVAEAISEYEQALRINPDDSATRDDRDRLRILQQESQPEN
jgi:tetratricopeptide (TPR) repeat protein